jgi:putative transposase
MDAQRLWTSNHAVFALYYHLVLVTKYRRRVLSPDMMHRAATVAGTIAQAWGGETHETNGEPDHLHVLVSLPPQVAPSAFVNNLKTVVSRRLRAEFPGLRGAYRGQAVLWSPSYFVVSAGGAPLAVIQQYIANQGVEPHP